MNLVNNTYEHALAAIYHKIDNIGIRVDTAQLAVVSKEVQDKIQELKDGLLAKTGIVFYHGSANKKIYPCGINLGSNDQVLEWLKSSGFSVPKIRKKDTDTHEVTMEESVGELAMQKLLANPNLWPKSLVPADCEYVIKTILQMKEYKTFEQRYIAARLFEETYYSNTNIAGTISGRRSSRKTIFGLGGNNQNFSKHSYLGGLYRKCFIPRDGNVFFFVDQISAEDWPVQALSENTRALEEMKAGVNRHLRFASFIFNVTEDVIKAGRAAKDDKYEMMYYLGKKSRHSNNYGVKETTMSESLAKEGYSVPKDECKRLLDKVNIIDPNVQKVFHKYVQQEVFNKKLLRTPLGRERQFFGLRQGEKNYVILNEAYSYIPQSIVGDNTGCAVLRLGVHPNSNSSLIQDGHDSLITEAVDREDNVIAVGRLIADAFDRTITFHNGISINIPIEGELGYNWSDTVKVDKPFCEENVQKAYKELRAKYN